MKPFSDLVSSYRFALWRNGRRQCFSVLAFCIIHPICNPTVKKLKRSSAVPLNGLAHYQCGVIPKKASDFLYSRIWIFFWKRRNRRSHQSLGRTFLTVSWRTNRFSIEMANSILTSIGKKLIPLIKHLFDCLSTEKRK